jgi:hypothetical protein
MKSAMVEFEVITYDVWGNSKDGYEVNDCFKQGTVEIPEKVFEFKGPADLGKMDSRLMKALRKADVFDRIQTRSVDIEGEPSYTLYFTRRKDRYPLCELRRMGTRASQIDAMQA